MWASAYQRSAQKQLEGRGAQGFGQTSVRLVHYRQLSLIMASLECTLWYVGITKDALHAKDSLTSILRHGSKVVGLVEYYDS